MQQYIFVDESTIEGKILNVVYKYREFFTDEETRLIYEWAFAYPDKVIMETTDEIMCKFLSDNYKQN